ncbi:hypothetical protein T439DRAFT_352399 [Meredithblackwellia eburnea MCA 4105]
MEQPALGIRIVRAERATASIPVLYSRSFVLALFAIAAGVSADLHRERRSSSISHNVQIQRRTDVLSSISTVATTLSTKVAETNVAVERTLANIGALSAEEVVAQVSVQVETLKSDVEQVGTVVAELAGTVLTAVSGETVTDQIAQDLTSAIAGLEGIISNVESQLHQVPTLSSVVALAAGIVNGPLSQILLGLDEILVGVLSLVRNLLRTLGLGGILSRPIASLIPL